MACLKVAPDYTYARNNLGYVLIKARKHADAVPVLEESIRRGKDGKYPLRNLANALTKLGRYSEAIEVRKKDTQKGNLTKSAQTEIEKLQARMQSAKAGEVPPDEPEDETPTAGKDGVGSETGAAEESLFPIGEADIALASAAEVPEVPVPERTKRKPATKLEREDILEELIEQRINRNQPVFGRLMRMLQPSDSKYSRYGRQFPVPGIGRIDLLAIDVDTNELVVIELKRDRSERDITGQISEYLGWVETKLAKPGQKVLGIICVWEATDRLRLAISRLHGVEVFEYGLFFNRAP